MRLGDLDSLEQFFLHESKRLREFMNSEDCDQEERKYISTFLPTVEWARKTVHGISTIDAIPVAEIEAYLQKRLDEWEALGDRRFEPANMWGYNFIMACFDDLERKDGDG